MFAVSLQNSNNAKQCFPLTANHSCWDWVRRRGQESKGEEKLSERRKTEDTTEELQGL